MLPDVLEVERNVRERLGTDPLEFAVEPSRPFVMFDDRLVHHNVCTHSDFASCPGEPARERGGSDAR